MSSRSPARSASIAALGRYVPVGLLGLAKNTILVRGVTADKIADTSAVRLRSGTETGVAPTLSA